MQEQAANAYGVPYDEVVLRLDKPTIDYLEEEAKRCGLAPAIVATALLRGACKEGKRMNIENGAPTTGMER